MRAGRLRSLGALSLSQSELSPAGVQLVVDALPHCPSLRGKVVELGSAELYPWALEVWGNARREQIYRRLCFVGYYSYRVL